MTTTTQPPLRVAIAQFAPGEDTSANLATIETYIQQATEQGAHLLVLPEFALFTAPAMDERFVTAAEPLNGPSIAALRALSVNHGIAVVFSFAEQIPDEPRIYNTIVAIVDGTIATTYRKIHLYDAFGFKESAVVKPGSPDQSPIFALNGYTIGLQTCYDVRFPEVSRHLIDAGAEVLVLPAEWVPGPLKEFHWRTLTTARAIENICFVVCADQSIPQGVGHSAIIDPMGIAIASLAEGPGFTVADITAERISSVREVNPALELRRFAVGSATSSEMDGTSPEVIPA